MRPSLVLFFVLLVGGALTGGRATSAQQPPLPNEYDLKAGYFYFFGGYVQWPKIPFPGADKEFVIGVLGSNPFGQRLLPNGNGFAINTPKVKTPIIQRKRIKVVEYGSVDEFQKNYSPCHILFISRFSSPGTQGETVQARVNSALQKTQGQPVLLVGDTNSKSESLAFAKSGVTICYWNDLQDARLKMIINRQAEKRAGLTIKASLLGLRIVTVLEAT